MAAKNFLILCPYILMIFVGLVLPSDGSHGILNPKSILFILSNLIVAVYIFSKQQIKIDQLKLLGCLFLAIIFLILWLFLSMFKQETTLQAQTDQFKLFAITFTIPILTLYLFKEKILTQQFFFKFIFLANFSYILLKLILVFLHFLGIVDIWKLIDTTGILFMRMNIYEGVERVQTSADIVAPFLIFFVLQSSFLGVKASRFFKISYFILSLCSTFLSFSRYLIAVYFFSCFLYWISRDLRGILKGIGIFFIFCVAVYVAIGPEAMDKVLERRLFSKDNFVSDETRVMQAEALLEQFEEAPFFGTGLGGYARGMIREPQVLHLYEVQWMAFLMQFGIIGIMVLLIPLVFISFKLVWGKFSRVRWSFLGLFYLWILSGFTNPFLISLASGIMYALFYMSAEVLGKMKLLKKGYQDKLLLVKTLPK